MADHIAKAPVQRLMRSVGAYLIAGDALDCMVDHLEQIAAALTKKGVEIAGNDGRTKLTAADISKALASE